MLLVSRPVRTQEENLQAGIAAGGLYILHREQVRKAEAKVAGQERRSKKST